MAKECVITGRKSRSGNKRSHAMNSSKRTWKANLQKYGFWLTANLKSLGICSCA